MKGFGNEAFSARLLVFLADDDYYSCSYDRLDCYHGVRIVVAVSKRYAPLEQEREKV